MFEVHITREPYQSGDGATRSAAPYIVNFAQVDANNDGNIDKKEFNAACAGHGEKPTVTAARPSSVWLPTEVGAGRGLCRGTFPYRD